MKKKILISFKKLYLYLFYIQPKAAATLCRPNVGDCDLPEFCLGHSPACPADVYMKDGTECYNGGQVSVVCSWPVT